MDIVSKVEQNNLVEQGNTSVQLLYHPKQTPNICV